MEDWLQVPGDAPVAMERVGPLDLPRLGAMVADVHAHLDMLDDPAGALERATLGGVMLIVTVVDVTESPGATFDSLEEWLAESDRRLADWGVAHGTPPEVKITLGVHPHNAKAYTAESHARVLALASDSRVCAIGETGLDWYYEHSSRDAQREAFRRQLEIAHELDLPAVLHLREAHDEGATILEEVGVPAAGCVVHCFGEGPEVAERFVSLGCHISFAGSLTFRSAEAARAAAASVPRERLLVETDCPFLAPEPCRGRSNEPAWVVLTATALAEARGEDVTDLAQALYLNAHCVFSRPTGSSGS